MEENRETIRDAIVAEQEKLAAMVQQHEETAIGAVGGFAVGYEIGYKSGLAQAAEQRPA